jgi:hypothetical protein
MPALGNRAVEALDGGLTQYRRFAKGAHVVPKDTTWSVSLSSTLRGVPSRTNSAQEGRAEPPEWRRSGGGAVYMHDIDQLRDSSLTVYAVTPWFTPSAKSNENLQGRLSLASDLGSFCAIWRVLGDRRRWKRSGAFDWQAAHGHSNYYSVWA